MRVLWTTDAAADLQRICDYIAKDGPESARRVAEAIIQGVGALDTFPERGRVGRVEGNGATASTTARRYNLSAMTVVKIDQMKLPGPWTDGYVIERQHTLSSEFLGHDSFGNPQFDTKRSELGELVFRLKNRNDKNTLDSIAGTAVQFIQGWNPSFDLIVPVPPSRKRVAYQPVVEIAMAIGKRLSKPVITSAVAKIKDTPELKDVFEYQQRLKLLEGAFKVDRDAVRDKRVLLVDDLYRSGATATVVAQDLLAGGAAAVYMLAMTKTRTRT